MSQQFKRPNKESEIQKILAALVFNDKNLLKKKSSSKAKTSLKSENTQTAVRCAKCFEEITIYLPENYFVCPRCHQQNKLNNKELNNPR